VSLSDSIVEALRTSRFLIVICSPRAKESRWIAKEIETFQELGRSDHILALLIDGEPADAFPEGLLRKKLVSVSTADGGFVETEQEIEPLAADIRAPAGRKARLLRTEILRLLAPIIGCTFDDLRQRHQERARRRMLATGTGLAALSVVLAGLSVFAFLERNAAAHARDAALAAEKLAEKNELIAKDNADLARLNAERASQEAARAEAALRQNLVAESDRVADFARRQADDGHALASLNQALQVVPGAGDHPDRPLTPAVRSVIERAARMLRLQDIRQTKHNIWSLAATADGRHIVSGSTDGWLQFWDMPGLTLRREVQAQKDVVSALQVSPDQRSVLVGGTATPTIWDIATATKKLDIKLPDTKLFSLKASYTEDGRSVVIGTNSNVAYVASAETGETVRELDGPDFEQSYDIAIKKGVEAGDPKAEDDPITKSMAAASFFMFGAMGEVAVVPGGHSVAIAGGNDPEVVVRLYDVDDEAPSVKLDSAQYTLVGGAQTYEQRITFSPDGKRLAFMARGQLRSRINIFDLASRALLSTLLSPLSEARTLAFSPDGELLFSGHNDGSIAIWCTKDGRLARQLRVQNDVIGKLLVAPEERLLISASDDGSVAVWRIPPSAKACPDHDNGAAASAMAAMAPLALLEGHGSTVNDVLFLRPAGLIVTASRDGSVRTWRVDAEGAQHFAPPKQIDPYWDATPSPAFFADGHGLLWSDDNGMREQTILDVDSGTWRKPPYGKLMVAGDNGGTLVSAATPFETKTWPASAVSTGGAYDGPLHSLEEPWDGNWTVAPDASRAAVTQPWIDFHQGKPAAHETTGEDEPLHLVDTARGIPLADLTVDDRLVEEPIFSADSSTVAGFADTADYSDELFFVWWDARTGRRIAMAKDITNKQITKDPKYIKGYFLLSDNGLVVATFPVLNSLQGTFRAKLYGVDRSSGKVATFDVPLGAGATAAYLSGDGKTFVIGNPFGFIGAWDTRSGKLLFDVRAGTVRVNAIRMSTDGRYVAAADISGKVWLFDRNGKMTSPMAGVATGDTITDIAFTPDGKRLAAVTPDRHVYLIDVDTVPAAAAASDSAFADWGRSRLAAFQKR
jgi:WD40 repeat protein